MNNMNFKLLLPLALILLCAVASAAVTQTATGTITDSTNVKQAVFNINDGNVGTANLNPVFYDKSQHYSPTEVYNFNNDPSIAGLDVGTVDETILVYPDTTVIYSTHGRGTFSVRSGSPIAFYTIESGNDRDLIEADESMLVFDPIYGRFDHGSISPVDIFPRYTTKCKLTPTKDASYIVIDNRHPFATYTMVEITSEY
jgi:hypothetical protein